MAVDVKKVIQDLGSTDWSVDENEAYKAIQLIKGLISQDDEMAKEYIKAIDEYTTQLAKKMIGSEKKVVGESNEFSTFYNRFFR